MNLLKYVKPYTLQSIIGSAAKLTEAILELYLPILMARMLDVGIKNGDRSYIFLTGINILVFALLGLFFAVTCQYCASVVSQGSGTNVRSALMKKISTLSYSQLDMFGASTLTNRITTDVNYFQQAVSITIRLVTRAPFICFGAVIMSVNISSNLSIIFACLIPILAFVLYIIMSKAAPYYKKVQSYLDDFTLVVKENLSGVRVIRAFSRMNTETKRSDLAIKNLSMESVSAANLATLTSPVTSILLNIGIILILFLGAKIVYKGDLSQGQLLALTTYATKILYALVVLANIAVVLNKAIISCARIDQILCLEPDMTYPSLVPILVPHSPAISFEDVAFSYSGYSCADENLLLKRINFSVAVGQTLGIIGVTGSGKTTLINLMQRLLDPTSGLVKINGVPTKDYPKDKLVDIFGIIPQYNTLFFGTIADNLRFAKQDITDEDVVFALKIAQCWEFVSALPDGINSDVQEGGKNFSGGQRQRLAVARAIVKRPQILILDDSLSALDYKTDSILRESIKKNYKNTTLIIISQRISSVITADSIIVLDKAIIAGFGTHEQLVKTCNTYKNIANSQLGKGDISVE